MRHVAHSLAHSSIGTPSSCLATRLRLLVSIRFQILFHPPSGVLLSCPSRYWFTIDQNMYLVLPHSRGRFPQDFSSLVVLKCHYYNHTDIFRVQDYHLLWFHFPVDSPIYCMSCLFSAENNITDFQPLSNNDCRLSLSLDENLRSHRQDNFTGKVWTDPFSLATTKGMGSLCM